jgi:hypothetical protein
MQQRENEAYNDIIIRLRTYAWNLHLLLVSGKKESYVPSHNCCKEKFLSNEEKAVIQKEIYFVEQILKIIKILTDDSEN